MLAATRGSVPLLRTLKYTFIPPSCYEIDAKPNPVVSVTIGNDEAAYCDLHFRVATL